MDVTPLVKEGAQIIQGYADGGFRVSGQAYDGAIFVFQDKTLEWNVQADVKSLSEDDFTALTDIASDIDVVLLGTGKTLIFPDMVLKNALKDKGLQVEAMDSGAACRTYNVLMAEGRRVVAALLPF
jgi:uncharacterized protein